MEESLVVSAEAVSTEAEADAVAAEPVADARATEDESAAAEPRVLMRLGFNKVLYSTDIHPHGYKPPTPGQTVRHEPKVSLCKQFAICMAVTTLFCIGTFAFLPKSSDDDHGYGGRQGGGDDEPGFRDCSASFHATHRSVSIGGDTIPTSDEEVQDAIGIRTMPGGVPGDDDDDDDSQHQLSWANCPIAQDCCEGMETCCTATRPSCVGVPGDKHCCSAESVFCPVGDGENPVGPPPVGLERPPKGAVATRDLPHALPGSTAPQCCSGECLSQTYADKHGAEAREYYCCTHPSCRGWTAEGERLDEGMEGVAALGALLLLCSLMSPQVRRWAFGTACEKRSVAPGGSSDVVAAAAGGGSHAREIEMVGVPATAVAATAVPEMTGVAVAYTPPVIEAVAADNSGDSL
jgi:hypothetical protein